MKRGSFIALAKALSSFLTIPGGKARVVADSDEHDAAGHLSEGLDVRLAQQDRRMSKLAGMTAEALPPEFYGPADSPTLLLCWGSSYGPCREAADLRNAAGRATAMLHAAQLWPLAADAFRAQLANRRRVICVEGNQTAQFAALLHEHGLAAGCETLLRYDGMPFTGAEIAERMGEA